MTEYRRILLVKVPMCPHPELYHHDSDFRGRLTFRPQPSLALACLCAFVDQYGSFGYQMQAVDINIEAYASPREPIDTTRYPGLLEKCVAENAYDVLGISTIGVFSLRWADDLAKLSRRYHPAAKIIIGGGYPTLFPERCLTAHEIDDAVIGEGEATLVHLLNRYNGYVDAKFQEEFPCGRFATREPSGRIRVIPGEGRALAMEKLPAPAWEYLQVDKYFRNSEENCLMIEGSRGCPYDCTYCCVKHTWGSRVRYKQADVLVANLRELRQKYGCIFHFVDDNLSFNKSWFIDFLAQTRPEQLLAGSTFSNYAIKNIDADIVDALTASGVGEICLAVESGSPEIQQQTRKNLDLRMVRDKVRMVKKKMVVSITWMVGFPNETRQQIAETFALVRELRAFQNMFSIVLPYPGTDLFALAQKTGVLKLEDNYLDNFNVRKCDYLSSPEWTCEQLQEMIYDINIEVNFLNNPLIEGDAAEIEYLLRYFERLRIRLPGHVILDIVLGYLYRHKKKSERFRHFYNSAGQNLKQPELAATFSRYLKDAQHPLISDFLAYCADDGCACRGGQE